MLHPPSSVSRRALAARALSLLTSLLFCSVLSFAVPASAKTAMQAYVEAMQPGWNLGNTLDATPNETAWGNPLTTPELIQQIKAQGFKSIRIPVTWDTGNRVGPAPSYTIDPAWLDRVQQVVDWSLEAGLYVMLNLHHDSGWVRDMPTQHDAVLAKFNALWSQIAPRFRDYPRELMFESINEPDFPNASDATKMSLLRELNTSFFHIVRNTGGGNATRPLVLPSFNTNSGQQWLDSLKATMDALDDPNLIATVHFYGFWPFSVNIAGVTTVDDAVIADINATVNNTYNTFVANGIPVVVGELGLLSYDPNNPATERGEVLKFFELITASLQSTGITWQVWDAGQLFDRTSYQWKDPELVGYYLQSVTTRSSTAATDLVFVPDSAPKDVVIPLNLNGNTFVSLTDGATPLTPGVDYTLIGDVLTVKAGALAAYASGNYGEKTVLTANFSAGMPWRLHVRHHAAPALGAAAGTKAGGIVIPTAFNGDILATMQASYVAAPNYPYPGQAEWTAFKQFGDSYQPDYANNTITLKKEFTIATTNEPVELTFHFWSGRKASYRLTFEPGGDIIADPQELVMYENGFSHGWGNWSWAATNDASTELPHSAPTSIAIDAGPWAALFLGGGTVDRSDYRTLIFWANGGPVGGQSLVVSASENWNFSHPSVTVGPLAANTWTKIEVPLDAIGVAENPNITTITIANGSGNPAPRFYIDDIHLTTAYPSDIVFVTGGAAPVITSATTATGRFDSPFAYTIQAINAPTSFSAADLPPGLTVNPTTGVISGTPTAAGSYVATITATNASGDGTQTLAIKIDPAPVAITFPAANTPFGAVVYAAYDGAPLSVSGTTSPAGVPVTITYNGSTTAPTLPGTYRVVITSNDLNYAGSVDGTFVITSTALVRHAPTLNGDLDGSIQVLSGESFAINGSGSISSDLLVPGTPTVKLNGHPLFAGLVDAAGATTPTNYTITLNGGAVARYVVRRVDPIAMPAVTAPAAPAGVRDVTLARPNDGAGDFATIRNLTLNGNAGVVAVPAGVYGHLTANGNSRLVLGVTGATQPSVYELQALTLNGQASLQIVGPVKLKLARGTSINGTIGSVDHPEWLELEIADGGLTLNGGAMVHAIVTAPNGAVTVSGTLHGRISADRLTLNGGLIDAPML